MRLGYGSLLFPSRMLQPKIMTKNKHIGSSFDDFFAEQGIEEILANCNSKNTSRFGKELIESMQEALTHAQAK